AHGPEGVDLAARDGRRAPRPGRVAHVVRTVVLVLPDLVASLGVEAKDPLLPFPLGRGHWAVAPLSLDRLIIGHVNLVRRHGRARETAMNGHRPQLLWPARRELVEDAGLLPMPVAVRAHPLRPVVGAGGDGGEEENGDRGTVHA